MSPAPVTLEPLCRSYAAANTSSALVVTCISPVLVPLLLSSNFPPSNLTSPEFSTLTLIMHVGLAGLEAQLPTSSPPLPIWIRVCALLGTVGTPVKDHVKVPPEP